MNKFYRLLICAFLFLSTSILAQTSDYWQKINLSFIKGGTERYSIPAKYQTFRLDLQKLKAVLLKAPMEFTSKQKSNNVLLQIPFPDGSFRGFKMEESVMMEKGLSASFPEFKVYSGQGIDHPEDILKVSITDLGFEAMIISPYGNVFIDPYHQFNTSDYIVYYKSDLKAYRTFICETAEGKSDSKLMSAVTNPSLLRSNGTQLRTYRLALACTGEYAAFYGGTVSGAMSGMVASMARVNAVYETEVSIRMVMIANNNLLIYLNASTDPYTNNSGGTMLSENQVNINAVIGSANYDIGHVFSTGGGGIAQLNSPCGTNKAYGVTGLTSPVGDAYDIDYVAHEIGHQFGGNHTFNSLLGSCGGNRSSTAAVEPGSGVTIMAYAGICSTDDLAFHSIANFSTKSFDEIYNFSVTGSGNGCAVKTSTGNNPPIVAGPGVAYNIPLQTAFSLTATGSDPDGDAITYSWEEVDVNSSSGNAWNTPSGNSPIFRPFEPTASPIRIFPKYSDILNNTTTIGELLPSYARTLKFIITARDNRSGGGGVTHSDDTVKVNVINTTNPFKVTFPNTAVFLNIGSTRTITWDISSTDVSPISCANVKISLSTDGGLTFPTVLFASTPNDGSEAWIIPNTLTSQARIKIEAAGNIFFDISNTNFIIQNSTSTLSAITTDQLNSTTLCSGQTISIGYNANATANAGNIFRAQMSNTNGSFASPINIGSVTSTAATGSISCTIPAGIGSQYRIRVISTNPSITGSDNGTNLSKIAALAATGAITGSSSVCQGQTGFVYSISSVSGATGYTWTVPSGAIITSGSNTNSITVSFGSSATSGTVSVSPYNVCFTGTAANLNIIVGVTPSAAGVITGTAVLCPNATGIVFSVPAIANASGYTWTLPPGANIVSGANTNSIVVNFGNSGGIVSVSGTNSCSGGISSSLAVNILSYPAAPIIAAGGPVTFCNGNNVQLSFTGTQETYYQWRKNGVAISGANSTSYVASQSGNYDVEATGALTFSNTGTVSIPDNLCTGAESNITVSGYAQNINTGRISVRLNINHTYDSDLALILQAPNGQKLGLINQVGGGTDNFINTVFADSGSVPTNASAPFTGLFKPEALVFSVLNCSGVSSNITSFAAIGGGAFNPNGVWKLLVYDRAAIDTGSVSNWSITFPAVSATCTNNSNAISVSSVSPAVITGYSPSSAAVGATVLVNGSGFSTATLVKFNSVNALFTVINDNQISTAVPVGAGTGAITITTICGVATGPAFTVTPAFVNLQLRVFIQGFYQESGLMTEIISTGKTDTVTIELHDAITPFNLAFTQKAVLNNTGSSNVQFPAAASGNSYYIVVKHRNSIETWSKNPVAFSANTSFDFTTFTGARRLRVKYTDQ